MTQKKIRVHFFKSTLCPRCRHAEKLLKQITEQRPDIEIYPIDVVRHPLVSLQNKVIIIPTLLLDNNDRLSGIFLTEPQIRSFLEATA